MKIFLDEARRKKIHPLFFLTKQKQHMAEGMDKKKGSFKRKREPESEPKATATDEEEYRCGCGGTFTLADIDVNPAEFTPNVSSSDIRCSVCFSSCLKSTPKVSKYNAVIPE
jgi:hypothetical protein